jgi:hypothetical protein
MIYFYIHMSNVYLSIINLCSELLFSIQHIFSFTCHDDVIIEIDQKNYYCLYNNNPLNIADKKSTNEQPAKD